MNKKIILFLASLLTLHFSSSFSQADQDLEKTLTDVNANAIKGHMTFLADDLIEGRQPGTKGFSIASKYIETQFISLGLQPGVDGVSYLQPVPFRKGIVDEAGSSFVLTIKGKQETLTLGKDFIVNPYFPQTESEVKAALVFVGFGVSAPELSYDDYKGVDVKGKIVVYLNGAPSGFPSNERAYFSSASKLTEAIMRGAVGVISFSTPTDNRSSWEAMVRRTKQGSFKWLNKEGKPANAADELKASVSFNPEFASRLFTGSGKTLETVLLNAKSDKPGSFSLNAEASIKVKTAHSFVQGSNLVGVLPGSDPKLKDEYIVYAAHLDHFGKGAPVKGDSIYNGAHDNASGVSILLGIAQAFRNYPKPPARSIIFAVVTGEEYGLLGSDYFINNPSIKPESIVANLAIDMPFFFHPVLDIVPYGAQHSSLSKQVEKAATYLNLKISPDPFPEQVVFVRSDHYSFIKKGIPALFIKSGFMTVPEDKVDRSKSDLAWRSTIYHTPQDDMSQAFDFNAAAMHVKVNFLIGHFINQETTRPSWNPNDFFGGKFGKKEKIDLKK
ncbi:MAG: M28 family peptidase [Cyclobacteriaceae bacterium]|nr:M28 family peptidase [Cyclobacteriaceae bacterium]